MNFLMLVTVFIALACVGMPLLALAAFMAFDQGEPPESGSSDAPQSAMPGPPGTGPAPFTS
mgnify:CR=1 FL=1